MYKWTYGVMAVLLGVTTGVMAEDIKPVADVKSFTGLVMADQGTERQSAQVGMALREGDRVLTGTGAGAAISYREGCDITIKENSIFTVTVPSVCGGGVLALEQFAVSPIASGVVAFKSALIPLGAAGAAAAAVVAVSDDKPASEQ